MRLIGRWNLFLLIPLFAVACADDRPDPNLVAPEDSEILPELTETPPQQDEVRTVLVSPPRVGVSLDAEGTFRPGEPITITVAADARFDSRATNVRVTLPEVEAARLSAFGDGFKVPTGTALPDHARWDLGGMSAGQQQDRTTTITIPSPGYYRVVAVATGEAAPGAYDDPFILDNVHDEKWLFIADEAGAVTDQFERERFPEGVVTLPGPLRGFPPASEAQRQEASVLGALVSTIRAWFFQSGDYVLHAQWYNPNSTSYGDATGVTAESELYDGDPTEANLVTTDEQVVGSSGYYTLSCYGGDHNWHTTIRGKNANTKDLFQHGWTELWSYQCGDTFDIVMPKANYNAYIDLRDAIPIIDDHLERSRSLIVFKVTDTGCGTGSDTVSCYSSGDDEINFAEDRMLSSDHTWVAAHEYGHALHEESLGGIWSASNCNPHYVDSASSYTCAQREGFADYLGELAADVLSASRFFFESYSSGESGVPDGEIEGHVAATFWDLTDYSADGNDATWYDGEYVGNVFDTCRVLRSDDSWPYQTRISDLVWCLENRVDYLVHSNRFPGAPEVLDESETASEPNDWNADSVRATWTQNLESN